MHLDFNNAVTLTGFTASALDIEREAAAGVAPCFSVGGLCEKLPYIGKNARIGSRIRAWSSADRGLVDIYNLVKILNSVHTAELSAFNSCTVELCGKMLVHDFIYQRGFSRTRNSCNAYQLSERNLYINILEIVFACALDSEKHSVSLTPLLGNLNFFLSAEILSGDRSLAFEKLVNSTCINDISAVYTRSGTDIDNIVSRKHGIVIMFNNNERISKVTETFQSSNQLVIVTLMKPYTRLIENIENSHKRRTNLSSKTYTLAFSAR